ncbi:sensor histidine kinase [Reichenbachiella sp. MALMAid0571]|uniref:tetratricopeptide repeat-containing sensor histidine kinase n=1 Tax=Reichenbachiella sp. MALMAid0571 TaxID=3143939 RepID=UPI0032DF2D34
MRRILLIAFLFFFFLIKNDKAYAQQNVIDSLQHVLVSAPDSTAVLVLNELSWNYKNSNIDSALAYSQQAYLLAQKLGNKQLIAASLNSNGDNYRVKGEYDTALQILNKSAEIYLSKNDSSELSRVYNNIGIIYDEKGSYQEALKFYFLGLRVAESTSQMGLQAHILGNIGIVYKKQKEPKKVLEYYQRSLEIYQKLDHEFGITVTSGNIGSVMLQTGAYDESIENSLNAIAGYEKLGYLRYVPYSLGNIGIAYDSLGNMQEAKSYYTDAYNRHVSFDNKYEAAYNAKNLAFLLLKLKNYPKASEYALTAINLAQEIDAKEMLKDAYNANAQIEFARGSYKSAYIFKEKYIDLQNELFEETKTKNIFELQTQYETEKKENQIATQKIALDKQTAINGRNLAIIVGLVISLVLLVVIGMLLKNRMEKKQLLRLQQKDIENKELQLNAAIDSQEKERSRFATDLHDGFGQLISILKLNVESIEKQNDLEKRSTIYDKSISILNEMYNELKNICFNLMPQSLVKFGLEPSLKEFAEKVNASEKLIVEVLVFDLNERLTELQEISIYRIVQEWVNNIMKYSDAQRVTIQLTKDEQEVTLTIEDDGMGFELSKLTESKGNGWKNIRSRTNLIHGDLEVDTSVNQRGTHFSINIPIVVNKEKIPVM